MRKPVVPLLKTALGGGMVLAALGVLLAVFQLQRASSRVPPVPTPSLRPAEIEAFFTDPGARVQDPELALVAALEAAQEGIDLAVYHFNLWSVRDALLEARARGVRVRMVTEGDNVQEPEVQALVAAGIPVVADRGPGLMHHKFVVVDGAEVWTGSMNLSYGGVHDDHNNLVRLASVEAARSFEREFEEMFLEGRFGAASRSDTPYPQVRVEDTTVEILFSPDDGVAARMIALVRQAEESIEVMAFALTSDALGQALIEQAQAGRRVRVVMEAGQATASGSEAETLRASAVEFRLADSPALLHHKVIIVDGERVLTGSYNFTRSAESRNDEAVLVIYDSEIAGAYQQEFEDIFSSASAGP